MTRKLMMLLAAMTTAMVAMPTAHAESSGEATEETYRHSIEVSPVSPLFRIWAVQYAYALTPNDALMGGASYANIKYDSGRSHAPGLILGYRRFLWKGLHLEYQLWPAYNHFYAATEGRYYNGFELWNEFRAGYEFNVDLGPVAVSVVPQVLCGFGLYSGNKSQAFLDEVDRAAPVFVAPVLFTGIKF